MIPVLLIFAVVCIALVVLVLTFALCRVSARTDQLLTMLPSNDATWTKIKWTFEPERTCGVTDEEARLN